MIFVKTMLGLGDAFAARPTIAALMRKDDLAIETPWPEVFFDIPGLEFIKPSNLTIRCAARNVEESKTAWVPAPEGARRIQLSYSLHPGCESIPVQIATSASVGSSEIDRDDFFARLHSVHWTPSPLGVFRIPTIRTEYHNIARNPAPGLVAAAVEEIGGRDWISLNDLTHYEVVSGDEKWPRVGAVKADFGELSLPSMLDIVARARCVVTPISWMAWAALAYQVPTFCIAGGYCSPQTIFGPLIESDAFKVLRPEIFCECFRPDHACDKSIPVERVREAARCVAR